MREGVTTSIRIVTETLHKPAATTPEEKEKHPDLPSSHAQPSTVSMDEVYEKYGISEGSRAFIGHGMAMYPNDDYLDDSPKPFFSRIQQ